jgi:hypothetical protein
MPQDGVIINLRTTPPGGQVVNFPEPGEIFEFVNTVKVPGYAGILWHDNGPMMIYQSGEIYLVSILRKRDTKNCTEH